MKTEMRIKTGDWSALESANAESIWRNSKSRKNRPAVHYRGISCLALLSLLAAAGYYSAQPKTVRLAAAPVVQTVLTESLGMGYEEIRARREADRQEEIELLNSVINHAQTDEETRKEALAQKMELAQRMETEAGIRAALAHMGYEETEVLCGAERIMLIIAENEVQNESDTLRVIDASAAVAQIDARDVKIILVKK